MRSLSQGWRDGHASLGSDASRGPSEGIADRTDAVDTARIVLALRFLSIRFFRLVLGVHLYAGRDQSNAEKTRQQLHVIRSEGGAAEYDTMATPIWSPWVHAFGFW